MKLHYDAAAGRLLLCAVKKLDSAGCCLTRELNSVYPEQQYEGLQTIFIEKASPRSCGVNEGAINVCAGLKARYVRFVHRLLPARAGPKEQKLQGAFWGVISLTPEAPAGGAQSLYETKKKKLLRSKYF